MHGSRESSVWRTLAVAFGDGLAFGVGLTLTNNATRVATTKTPISYRDIRPLVDRITQIEQRIERARVAGALPAPGTISQTGAQVADAVLAAMDARFGEIDAQVARRVAELELKLRIELEALDAQELSRDQDRGAGVESRVDALRGEFSGAIDAQRNAIDTDVRRLRNEIVAANKEFAESLSLLMDEQIEHTIGVRLQTMQERVREAARDESLSAYATFGHGVENLVESRIQALREELGGREHSLQIELDALDARNQADKEALRGEMAQVRKELAGLGNSVEAMVESRLHALREEMMGKDRQIEELRARLDGHEQNLKVDLEALREEVAGAIEEQRSAVDNEIGTLRTGIAEAHKEFTDFGNGVETFVESRLQALREETEGIKQNTRIDLEALRGEAAGAIDTLRTGIAAASKEFTDFGRGVETSVESRLQSLREEMDGNKQSATLELEAQRRAADQDLHTLRGEMAQVNKEFAESLSRLVDDQIEHTITLRLQAMQEQMREAAREESLSAYSSFGNGVETLIERRIQALREEMGGNNHLIADLQARLNGHEHNLLELVIGLGQRCMQAADLIAVPAAPPQNSTPKGGGGAAFSAEAHIAPAGDPELPSFARQEARKPLWRPPIVSCFLIATTGLLALHYLAG